MGIFIDWLLKAAIIENIFNLRQLPSLAAGKNLKPLFSSSRWALLSLPAKQAEGQIYI